MKENALLLGTLFEQPSLFIRLKDELTEASCELRQHPKAYLTAALRNDTLGGSRRRMLLQFGIATGIVLYAAVFAAILVFWTLSNRARASPPNVPNDLIKVFFPGRIDHDIEGPKDKDHAGGGGGAAANLPPPSRERHRNPRLNFSPWSFAGAPRNEPVLPVIETMAVDERINMKGRPSTYRLVRWRSAARRWSRIWPGMGTGTGGGLGSGDGPGFGPGSGGNIGGSSRRSGRLNDNPDSDQERPDTRPVALNRPRPNYTEAARKNKIQGVIRARVLVGADGSVQKVVIVRPLTDGLNEEAIAAVYQMRFRAATRSGQSVASWITLEVEFNLR